jgi:RNA polymerase sigma-54 factor
VAGPRFEQRPETALRQEMRLSAHMIQALEMLECPAAELEARLQALAESNEALRVEAPAPDGSEERAGSATRPEPVRPRRVRSGTDELHPELEAPLPSSVARLHQEIGLLDLEPVRMEWARFVVECLDARGCLSLSDEELLRLAAEHGLDPDAERLGRATATVQQLEPRGIGARNLVEALLLQIDPADSDYALLCRLLEDFLEEVAKNRLPRVARELGIDLERLGALLARLRELCPTPLAGLEERASPAIRPELRVACEAGRVEVTLVRSELPTVTVDPEVERLSSDLGLDERSRADLRRKVGDARRVVEAARRRGETLLAVAAWVFQRQGAFLERGRESLRPLRMSAAAEALGLSLSTVSRAVAGKYVDTPFGVLPLRVFFPAGAGGSNLFARESLVAVLRAILAAEDPGEPLSDDEIARRVGEQGFVLARRSIAKLRDELGIPSSYRRRRFRPPAA